MVLQDIVVTSRTELRKSCNTRLQSNTTVGQGTVTQDTVTLFKMLHLDVTLRITAHTNTVLQAVVVSLL